jgi:hypothetical protein
VISEQVEDLEFNLCASDLTTEDPSHTDKVVKCLNENKNSEDQISNCDKPIEGN